MRDLPMVSQPARGLCGQSSASGRDTGGRAPGSVRTGNPNHAPSGFAYTPVFTQEVGAHSPDIGSSA